VIFEAAQRHEAKNGETYPGRGSTEKKRTKGKKVLAYARIERVKIPQKEQEFRKTSGQTTPSKPHSTDQQASVYQKVAMS